MTVITEGVPHLARQGRPVTVSVDIDPLLRRLRSFGGIQDDDQHFLTTALPASRLFSADTVLIAEGSRAEDVHLVVGGLACRCKKISRGRSQITGYLLPGDFCDLHVSILGKMDHTIMTLTETRVIRIPRAKVDEIFERPSLTKALLFSSLVDASISREWVTNVGQRSALERLAHHFLEMFCRMQVVGLTAGNTYELAVTQTELARTVGLSLVHTNKSLRALYKAGVLRFVSGKVEIIDMIGLRKICEFDDAYLHIGEMKLQA